MKKFVLFCVTVLSGFMIFSCYYSTSPSPQEGQEPDSPITVYFNSFESATDTANWVGIFPAMFVSDPSPSGGEKSLHIGGGCIQPTAYIDLPAQPDSGNYTISCWGKKGIGVGSVLLTISGETYPDRTELILRINQDDWTFIKSEELIYCARDKQLRLEILCGGIVDQTMFVDQIKVEKVN